MKPIIIGIIGLGYWGPNLVRNFHANKRFTVKYACDLLEKNRDKIKSNYPVINTVKEYDTLLEDNDVELICIATPPRTHYELATKAILAGKHVFIEKPMTTNVGQGEDLVELAKRKGVELFVDHTFLYSPPVQKMKQLIKDGMIGEPLYFDSERVNLGLLQKDVNVIWDLAIHDFSIIKYLFPEQKLLKVRAFGSRHRHPELHDLAHVFIEYESGFSAHVHVSWLSPVKIRKTIVGGSKQMMWYDDVQPFEKIKVYDKGISIDLSKEDPFYPIYRSGDILIPELLNHEPLAKEVDHIADCLINDEKPMVGGEEGLEIVKILSECDKCLKRGEM